ncbi:hypothetical protein W97_04905 [Coniosporium apollinis CBS 100218]|uniref:Uncharacterized protein n=1 Tax=Coniosporium apollinis (strain CBS 100218) TaxID=1168221 RepID=R7YVJ6_CONA1|nr:uncharacterized protein W97_04905 [Coniosporium apollinis CBS 100218]EON65666.1 hypothetical protein W97_04905 [Coniosporium apollinis CBS 100218]
MDTLSKNAGHDFLVYIQHKGMEVMTETELRKYLAENPDLAVIPKDLPRGSFSIHITFEDTLTQEERAEHPGLPNMKSSLAGGTLPPKVFFKRLLFNQFKDLYVLSPRKSRVSVIVDEDEEGKEEKA